MKSDIQKKLQKIQPASLSSQEQDRVWEQIRTGIQKRGISAQKKPSAFSAFRKSIAITIMFGLTAGTAFAADNAKPGDALFPIDRALENLQLAIASESKQSELKMRFALERVSEVKDVLDEISVHQTDTAIKEASGQPSRSQSSSNSSEKSVENQQPSRVESEDGSQSENQDTTMDSKGIADTEQERTLENSESAQEKVSQNTQASTSMQTTHSPTDEKPDDASTSSDDTLKGDISELETELEKEVSQVLNSDLSDTDKKRIEVALGTALSFLGDIKSELSEQDNQYAVEYIDLMLEEINNQIGELPSEATFEIDLSQTKKRVKFEVVSSKDSKQELRIEVENNAENVEVKEEDTERKTDEKKDENKQDKQQSTKLQIKDGGMTITSEDLEDELAKEKDEENENDNALSANREADNATTSDTSLTQDLDVNDKNSTTTPIDQSGTTTDKALNKDGSEVAIEDDERDGTTTVKVILEKLDKDFEISVTDQDATIHEIIQQYTAEFSTTTNNQ